MARKKKKGDPDRRTRDRARRDETHAKRNDEEQLWQRATADVTRLGDSRRGQTPRSSEAPRPRRRPRVPVETESFAELLDGTEVWDVGAEGERFWGRATSTDQAMLAMTREGLPAPGADIDLHGYRLEDARRALSEFVLRARGERLAMVLVITGVGSRGSGSGVIRQSIPGWLSSPPLASHVACFASARERDGGLGATYVRLR